MSGCTGVFIEFSMKCCSSNAVKHKLPTSEELRVNGSGYSKMHCSPSPSFPLPEEEGGRWSPHAAGLSRGLCPGEGKDRLSCTLGLEGVFGPARQQLHPHVMQPSHCWGPSNSLWVTAAARSAGGTGGGSDFGLL